MDSRYHSRRHYLIELRNKWPLGRKISYFILSLVLALFITATLAKPEFSDTMRYTLFILCFAVFLWVTEAIPPFAVGMFIIGFEVAFLGSSYLNSSPVDVTQYVNTWSSNVIWLMLGGFFLAQGLKKTELDQQIFSFSTSMFGTRPKMVLLGMMLTTAILSMVMSNTATTAMMVASIVPFVRKQGADKPLSKALLLGIPAAASVGGMGTIIGSPPNVIAVGALENAGVEVNFVQWMMYGFPTALLLVYAFWFLLNRKYKMDTEKIEIESNSNEEEEHLRPPASSKVIMICTLLLTIGLWLTNPIHHISSAVIAGIPIIVLTMTGIMVGSDIRSIPWDTLMLVAGGLALGKAIDESGLAQFYLNKIDISSISIIMVMVLFGLITIVLSNIMSNTATTSILMPIAIAIMPQDMLPIALVIGLCASNALLLPVSTPPNAIAYSTGYIEQAEFRLGGVFFGLVAPILLTCWILLLVS